MQEILNIDAKEVASAAAFSSASDAYLAITERTAFFLSDKLINDTDMSVIGKTIATLGAYAIDRKAAGPVLVTQAKREGFIAEDQAQDLYVELAMTIFAAHAISAHDAIVALQARIRAQLAEQEAEAGGRVTTMPLKDSIFRPIGTGLEMDPERVAALALGARKPLDDETGDKAPALSLGKPEKPNVGAMALGTIAEGEGNGADSEDDGKGDAAGAEAGQGAGSVSRDPADAAGDDRGADDAGSAGGNPAHGSAKRKRAKAKS